MKGNVLGANGKFNYALGMHAIGCGTTLRRSAAIELRQVVHGLRAWLFVARPSGTAESPQRQASRWDARSRRLVQAVNDLPTVRCRAAA